MASNEQDNRTLGGYKATLHNPNTSTDAKHHAADVLQSTGTELSADDAKYLSAEGTDHPGQQHHATHEDAGYHADPVANKGEGDEHDRRVLGGYKATLHNPSASEEAKRHAGEVLQEHGVQAHR